MKYATRFSVHKGWKLLIADMGISPADALKLAGLPADIFNRDEASLSTAEYYNLWLALEQLAGEEQLPLMVGSAISAEVFDPPIFASLCSPNLNVALQRLQRFKRLIGPMKLNLQIDDQATAVSIECYDKSQEMPISLGTMEMVFFAQLSRMATRAQIVPKQVSLIQLPKDVTPYNDYFGISVIQGEINEIIFTPEDAKRPFLTDNAGMWSFFEPGLQQKLSELDSSASMSERIKNLLLEMLPSGQSSMEETASRLAVSKRTLQRRLNEEGESFQSILQQTREQLAKHYLTHSEMSQGEISFLLGFNDTNSFIRAYSSWTGQSPGQYRTNIH